MKGRMITGVKTFLRDDRGAALLMSILFTLIINGLALTLFATTSRDVTSSNSQIVSNDSFNTAEAAVNIGMLRIKALMEANDPVDVNIPFEEPPFTLAAEGGTALTIDQYDYFDLVTLSAISDSSLSMIQSSYVDTAYNTYIAPIDGFFVPETSNPVKFDRFLSGADPVYSSLLDTGESALLRGWRIYLQNDNDNKGSTALLVAIGYLLDPQNNMLYQKRIEVNVYIHGKSRGNLPDPSGQVTSSERGAKTGRFRVTSDLEQPVESYDLR